METLIILNYSNGTIHFYKVSKELLKDYEMEDIICDLGFNLDEISYMWAENIEEIHHHKYITQIEDENILS